MADQLTVNQAAAALRKGRDVVLRAIHSGDLAAAKDDSGRWLIDPTSFAAMLTSRINQLGGPTDTQELAELRVYYLDEVAAQTGLSLTWLKAGCRTGRLDHIRAGKQPQMTKAQVQAAIDAANPSPTPDADPEITAELLRRANTSTRRRQRAA